MDNLIIVSYATPSHQHLQVDLDANIKRYPGIKHVMYDPESIKILPRYDEAEPILHHKKLKGGFDRANNAGYWIWKPMIILDQLSKLDPGSKDVVLYLDVSVRFDVDPRDVLPEFDCICTVKTDFRMSKYVKQDCFVAMDMNKEEYKNVGTCWDGCIWTRKQATTYYLMQEWFDLMTNIDIVGDGVGRLPNAPDFSFHCHDQAVLSLLFLKYNLPMVYYQHFYDYNEKPMKMAD